MNGLPPNMRIKKFVLLIKELHPDDEELTRTRKVRRAFIYERYKGLIEDIYAGKRIHNLDVKIHYEDGRISSFQGQVVITEVNL